jgi:hypothetical protein
MVNANKEITKTEPTPTADGVLNKIEEAAYYSWLNRARYAQPGDELNDWIDAEKEVLNKTQKAQPLNEKTPKVAK